MAESPARGRVILVAEDHEDILDNVRTFLEGRGYRVVGAENGARAVELAVSERPDLIMMDLNMPVLDGIEAARRIRLHPSLRDVPILANSAYGEHGMRFSVREEELGPGFTFYIAKPFEFDKLAEVIGRLLPPE